MEPFAGLAAQVDSLSWAQARLVRFQASKAKNHSQQQQ